MSLEHSYGDISEGSARSISERSAGGVEIAAEDRTTFDPYSASTWTICWLVLTGQGSRIAEALTADPKSCALPQAPPDTVTRPWDLADRAVKRVLDIAIAMAALVLLSPILLMTAILVAATLGLPVLFHSKRIGRCGRIFPMHKFRTMVPDAQARLQAVLDHDPVRAAEWKEFEKLRDDPRVTRLGRMLRRTSIDELPQLVNVLKGDMSCVGPRPVTIGWLERYGSEAETYLRMKPGLTGLWQVSGRSTLNYDSRVALDAYYARRRTLLLDLAILLRTIPVLCGSQDSY